MTNITRLAAVKIFGIDVSHHNGKIDWDKVKAAGVQFAYIKASEGITLGDDQYATNVAQARARGIPPGPYHFFIPADAVADQVKNFVSRVGTSQQPGDLPPVIDCETPANWLAEDIAKHNADWMAMTVDQRVDKIIAWATAIQKQYGVQPLIYASPSFITDVLGSSPRLKPYLLWIANYKVKAPTIPAPWTDYTFWQDSESGTVSGVSGGVDTDWYNGSLAQLKGLTKQVLPLQARVAHKVRGWFQTMFGWVFGR
jgi:lysozyme